MAATRLGDAQKQELVKRWQAGEASAALAAAFGCSANTVIRVVKGALEPALYEQLKKERGRAAAAGEAAPEAAAEAVPEATSVAIEPPEPIEPDPAPLALALDEPAVEVADDREDGPAVLAIDDADDFGDDGEESEGDDIEVDDIDADGAEADGDVFVAVPVGITLEDRPAVATLPLEDTSLPASLYMLVDKTVELEPRPLSDFPELGRLSDDEQRRQALVVFANPRQAKRHCGRTQRVIKLPDSRLIHRTAPYLLNQGITRVVLEGAVYALPGS